MAAADALLPPVCFSDAAEFLRVDCFHSLWPWSGVAEVLGFSQPLELRYNLGSELRALASGSGHLSRQECAAFGGNPCCSKQNCSKDCATGCCCLAHSSLVPWAQFRALSPLAFCFSSTTVLHDVLLSPCLSEFNGLWLVWRSKRDCKYTQIGLIRLPIIRRHQAFTGIKRIDF